MDVPISLAILLAWAGSLHATLFKGPHVYFESAAMFVFFLTLSRWLEARQADRAENLLQSSIASIRPIVKRYRSHLATNGNANDIETIHINQVQAGDHILVEQGDAIPVDSILLEGDIYVSEAILTGESAVVRHLPNSTLLAGSKVYEGIGRIQATSSFTQSRIAKIEQLAADAENQSNPLDQILGRVASVFVPATMLLAIFACWLYWSQGIDRAIEVTLAVLVITCPCALSLAVPLARSAAVRAALNQAILVCKPQMLYQAKSINTLIMDKTGTLTTGNYLLVDMQMLANDITREDVIRIAMTLEQFSSHPVARAFTPEMIKQSHVYDSLAKDQVFKQVTLADHQHFRGGVSGLIGDKHYRLSSDNNIGFTDNNTASNSSTGQTVLQLTRNGRRIARFQLADQLRKEAVQIIDYYKSAGIKTILLSGDQEAATRHLAQQAGFDEFYSGNTPEQKLSFISSLQQQGNKVMMVGDGVNDGPVLAQADISVAMQQATTLSRQSAGIYLLHNSLHGLKPLHLLSIQMRRRVIQNLYWAASYNLTAVPLALLGLVAPWQAALGMSASSLLVTLNAARINQTRSTQIKQGA